MALKSLDQSSKLKHVLYEIRGPIAADQLTLNYNGLAKTYRAAGFRAARASRASHA